MDSRTPCNNCGGLNAPGATFCTQCYQRFEEAAQEEVAAQSLAARLVPGGFQTSSYAPTLRPAYATAEPTAALMPQRAFESSLSTGTLARGSYVIKDEQGPVRWRWWHLSIFGMAAWGLPEALNAVMPERRSFSRLVDASLSIQIFGYLLAACVVALLVKTAQKGDWSSLGIHFSDLSSRDVGRGALFGLILLAIWLPIGFALSSLAGMPVFDQLITTLVGETSSGGLILAAVVVVVGAPVIEEIYFRGLLYTKLARRNVAVAIVVTSLLFVSAHGALLIPPLLLMGFALGLKRRKESLWFTIGAHATWNLVIIFMAVYVLLGPSKIFSPSDASYQLRHSADWQRVSRLEENVPGAAVDLALEGPAGSALIVSRIEIPPVPVETFLVELLNAIQAPTGYSSEPGQPVPSRTFVQGAGLVYEAAGTISAPEGRGETHLLAVVAKDSQQVIVLNLICPDVACQEALQDFERVLGSVRLKS